MPSAGKPAGAVHRGPVDESIRSSGLDWTIVLPARLTNDPVKGTHSVGDGLPTGRRR
ncbi:NAD(P)H-binding protein [Streptomyces griseoruber]|uniref:NAD(P)H-binding protein n=1 Tax=Streptomyces griseoruber TaxID=1943 RepID=UPI0012FF36A1|nr:NAD(P)H-binding protein [Streptomyces griseoruber]